MREQINLNDSSSEEINSLEEIKTCEKAIELYLKGCDEYSKKNLNEEYDINPNDVEYLVNGRDGLRYGAPGWGHAKLKYDYPEGESERHFFVNPNGMNEKQFQLWQSYIGKKFEENNLKFFYFPVLNEK